MRRERFDTPGTLRLDLSVGAGEIDVQTHDGTETTAGATGRPRHGGGAGIADVS